ncbi:MAG: STAS domain-containing protein [Planctomycetota bacterium]|jgi:anti-sigma B factor antagonist|nr:STAS domain-containing protein [Planctomycetota bacterium]MDP7248797.1 STAS domain-containing protein [Planctomycetota bacterium]MDP7560355.1 STAS domain-containing protein [Planctomycetota bacterium]
MPDFEAKVATLKDNKEVAICQLSGGIDTSTLLNFQSALYRLRRQGIKRLVLDMENISYVNSTGFSVLLKHAELFKKSAGELVLANMHSKVQLVFDVLGLSPYINLFPSVEEAVAGITSDEAVTAPPEDASSGN